MRVLFFVATSLVVLGASAQTSLYSPTPFGHEVLTHCMHTIPSGSRITALESGATRVIAPDSTVVIIPPCDTRNGSLSVVRRAGAEGPLPPDYDGWLQYAAVNVSKLGRTGGFDAFTNTMSVPDVPEEPSGGPLYLFPGLQNIDWIPKVDPEPRQPFDIIQPVLQYPGSFFSRDEWILKSWYVTLNAGALMTSGVSVKPGDAVLCNMTRTGPSSFSVSGVLKSDPSHKPQVQHAENSRLDLQPWAYNTLECYGCKGCKTYPKNPVTFTDNKLYQAGELVSVPGSAWAINPKPAKKLECHESTTVAANGDTTISFQ